MAGHVSVCVCRSPFFKFSSVEVFKGQDIVDARDDKEESTGDTNSRCFVLWRRNMCMCACVAVCMCVLLFRACSMFASIANARGREERQAQASYIWGRLYIYIYTPGAGCFRRRSISICYAWELDRPRPVAFGASSARALRRWLRVGAYAAYPFLPLL